MPTMVVREIAFLLAILLCCGVAAADIGSIETAEPADSTAVAGENDETGIVEEDQGDSTAFPLPNVIVIGKRDAAPPTIIIRDATETDFAEWNVRTAAGALARTPGVNVQIGGSSGDASPWIRGFRDRDILVLFDGIPVGSALEGTLDLNDISLNSVATTRVMKGAPSVIYGANGLGGVIDLIPRAANRFDTQSVAAEFAEDGMRSYRGHIGSTSGAVGYFFTAGYEEADEYSLSGDFEPQISQPTGERINSDYTRATATLLLDYADWRIGHTSFFINMSDVERGLMPRSTTDDPDFERLTVSQRKTIGLSNRFESIPLSVKVYYNEYDSELTIYTDASYSTVDEIERGEDYTIGGVAYAHLQTWETGTLVLSGSLSRDVFEAEDVFEDSDRAELNTLTLSAEHQTVLANRLSLAVGAIYSHVDQPAVDRGISDLSPQVAIGFQISDKLSVHASAAQRTRFPKLREFYRRRWGNPDLVEQSADNYDLGVTYAHNARTTTDLTFFHSKIDGLIDRPTRRSIYENLSAVDSDGFELASGGWLTDSVYMRFSYDYVDITEALPDGSERQLRSRARHSAFADLRFRLSDVWQVSLNGQYISDLYDLDDDEVHTRLPSIFVVDAKTTVRFSDRLSVYVAVSNVTDEDYYFRIGDPRPGRVFAAGFTFDRQAR
jgi:iron complex outermembrane receptor protein